MEIKRKAGILLHPTSLPNGVLDHYAWRFLEWMVDAGLSIWQMLPLTPPGEGLSPYQSDSAFAMNPHLFPKDGYCIDPAAFDVYLKNPPDWLEDYALFKALKSHFSGLPWYQWPDPYKHRDAKILAQFAKRHDETLLIYKRQQFASQDRWKAFKKAANTKGIQLFGDMAIFVAHDSADVWVNPHLFKLDKNLLPTVITGVPPDSLSDKGQSWGNPNYNWDIMENTHFSWWLSRFEQAFSEFDVIRIDHFRGFQAVWEIDYGADSPRQGRWVKSTGEALLDKLSAKYQTLPLVAEDLGFITHEVISLKNKFNLPGMSILQYGFDGLGETPHMLNHQVENSVVYTGTHDNNTTLGWYHNLDVSTRKRVDETLCSYDGEMPWNLIQAALASCANWAIIPIQDLLSLDSEARMNTPGTCGVGQNWVWRFDWHLLTSTIKQTLRMHVERYGRI